MLIYAPTLITISNWVIPQKTGHHYFPGTSAAGHSRAHSPQPAPWGPGLISFSWCPEGKHKMPHVHPTLLPHIFCTYTWRENGNYVADASPDQMSCSDNRYYSYLCTIQQSPIGYTKALSTRLLQLGTVSRGQFGRKCARCCLGHQSWGIAMDHLSFITSLMNE